MWRRKFNRDQSRDLDASIVRITLIALIIIVWISKILIRKYNTVNLSSISLLVFISGCNSISNQMFLFILRGQWNPNSLGNQSWMLSYLHVEEKISMSHKSSCQLWSYFHPIWEENNCLEGKCYNQLLHKASIGPGKSQKSCTFSSPWPTFITKCFLIKH